MLFLSGLRQLPDRAKQVSVECKFGVFGVLGALSSKLLDPVGLA